MGALATVLELDEAEALPFMDTLGDQLTIAARCGECGWIGKARLYTSTARSGVAIACWLHVCVSPKRDLIPTVLQR